MSANLEFLSDRDRKMAMTFDGVLPEEMADPDTPAYYISDYNPNMIQSDSHLFLQTSLPGMGKVTPPKTDSNRGSDGKNNGNSQRIVDRRTNRPTSTPRPPAKPSGSGD